MQNNTSKVIYPISFPSFDSLKKTWEFLGSLGKDDIHLIEGFRSSWVLRKKLKRVSF